MMEMAGNSALCKAFPFLYLAMISLHNIKPIFSEDRSVISGRFTYFHSRSRFLGNPYYTRTESESRVIGWLCLIVDSHESAHKGEKVGPCM